MCWLHDVAVGVYQSVAPVVIREGLARRCAIGVCFARAWYVIDISPTNRRAYAARRAFTVLMECTQAPLQHGGLGPCPTRRLCGGGANGTIIAPRAVV